MVKLFGEEGPKDCGWRWKRSITIVVREEEGSEVAEVSAGVRHRRTSPENGNSNSQHRRPPPETKKKQRREDARERKGRWV